ncbi:MAG TPA: hypothetical protein VNZ49_11980 [Bacteroidia bacterium]|jgi:hypothetical protein|nr:hypothetical protein [Bacteroidia bacterium]
MVKKFLSAALLFACLTTFAQEVKIKESHESFSNGSHNALIVTVYVDDMNKVQKEWKSRMKDFGYQSANDKGNEYIFDNVKFKDLSNNPMDVYAKFEVLKDEKAIKMYVAYDMGGDYISSSAHGKEFDFMKKMMKEFAVKTSKDYVEDQLKDASKVLVKLQDKQKGLESDNKNLDDDIKNYEEKIKKAKDNIEKNKKDIETKKTEIETQKKVVEGVKKKLDSIN